MPTDPIRRIPPPASTSSKENKVDDKKFREELQKVEKVGEIDPDEQSRKRQRYIASELANERASNFSSSASPLPSPFDLHAASEASTSIRSVGPNTQKVVQGSSTPVPSPSYSPAPTVQPVATSQPEVSSSSSYSLPLSPVFWQSADVSSNDPDPSSQQSFTEYRRLPQPSSASPSEDDQDQGDEDVEPIYQPEPESASETLHSEHKSSKGKETVKTPKEEPDREEPLQKKETQLEGTSRTSSSLKSEERSPFALPAKGEGKQTGAEPKSQSQSPSAVVYSTQSDEQGNMGPAPTPFPGTMQQTPTAQKGESKSFTIRGTGEKTSPPVSEKEETSDKDQSGGQGGQQHPSVLPAIASQLPADVVPMVQQATTHATSNLSDQTIALFQRMVGEMYVINARPGISTTEVMLTSSAFTGSKFYGSTITIEKYATAPNALNIRLSGSTEAVNAFNDNLSSLIAAFEHSKFAFTVRIETAYQSDKADKPVLHRKDKKGDQDSSKEGKK